MISIDYLCGQAQQMAGHALLCLAEFAGYLGFSCLLDTAAEALVKLPWEQNVLLLSSLLKIWMYTIWVHTRDTDRRNTMIAYDRLLHHP